MAPRKIPIKDRIWKKIKKGKPDDCWPWQGYCLTNGYGIIYENHDEPRYIHREIWQISHKRKIPPGKQVLHRCDNRPCGNPKHLKLGTNRQNVDDKVRKGRQPKGEQIFASKLKAHQVLTIRADLRSQYLIAADWGVDQSLISRIKSREVWKHI